MTSSKGVYKPEPSFISFGCWNNGFCNSEDLNEDSNDFSRVAARLIGYMRATQRPPEFICILGDNYYPDMTKTGDKKVKTTSYPNLKSGFDCIEKIFTSVGLSGRVNVDILVGNHDIEETSKMVLDGFPKTKSMTSGQPDSGPTCKITESQISLVRGLHERIQRAATGIQIVLFNYRVVDNTIVIMLDSNLYFETFSDNCYCYIPLLNAMGVSNARGHITVEWLKSFQEAWLTSTYEEVARNGISLKNVVIMAHHPLCCFKKKDDKNRFDCPKTDEYLLLCSHIYKTFNRIAGATKFYYNSADLHTYQAGKIVLSMSSDHDRPDTQSIVIEQYIAGTGGAQLEPAISDLVNAEARIGSMHVNYTVTDAVHTNGFLIWTISNKRGNLNVTFIQAGASVFDEELRKLQSQVKKSKKGGKKIRKNKKTLKKKKKSKKHKKSKSINQFKII
jgi:hypothetical protein